MTVDLSIITYERDGVVYRAGAANGGTHGGCTGCAFVDFPGDTQPCIGDGAMRKCDEYKCIWVKHDSGVASPEQADPVRVTADSLLTEAAVIMAERGKQYDQPGGERSMAKTVTMFNTATGRDLNEVEGWFFMECLKNVRFFQNTNKPHEDSIKDKIAYSALMGEAAMNRGLK